MRGRRRVDLVAREAGSFREALVTVGARVLDLPCVRHLMPGQVILLSEGLLTPGVGARKGAPPLVAPLMAGQGK